MERGEERVDCALLHLQGKEHGTAKIGKHRHVSQGNSRHRQGEEGNSLQGDLPTRRLTYLHKRSCLQGKQYPQERKRGQRATRWKHAINEIRNNREPCPADPSKKRHLLASKRRDAILNNGREEESAEAEPDRGRPREP